MWILSLPNVINLPEFSQRKKWKAAQVRDPCAKRDFSVAKRRVSMEMQPYVITVDDSLASAATMPTAAAVPEGGGEDGYRTVLDSIACSTQPCIGVYVAGDSLAPTAGGRTGRRGSLVVFAAWAMAKLGHNLSVVLLIGMDQSIC